MKKVKVIFLFPNGSIAAVDEQGQQIPELQGNAVSYLWAAFATAKGYDVNGTIFEGELGNVKIVGEKGNWTLVPV